MNNTIVLGFCKITNNTLLNGLLCIKYMNRSNNLIMKKLDNIVVFPFYSFEFDLVCQLTTDNKKYREEIINYDVLAYYQTNLTIELFNKHCQITITIIEKNKTRLPLSDCFLNDKNFLTYGFLPIFHRHFVNDDINNVFDFFYSHDKLPYLMTTLIDTIIKNEADPNIYFRDNSFGVLLLCKCLEHVGKNFIQTIIHKIIKFKKKKIFKSILKLLIEKHKQIPVEILIISKHLINVLDPKISLPTVFASLIFLRWLMPAILLYSNHNTMKLVKKFNKKIYNNIDHPLLIEFLELLWTIPIEPTQISYLPKLKKNNTTITIQPNSPRLDIKDLVMSNYEKIYLNLKDHGQLESLKKLGKLS